MIDRQHLMIQIRSSLSLAAVFITFGVMLVGCQTPRQTVVVTDRPTPPAQTEVLPVDPVTDAEAGPQVEAGRFDYGKMWTFDNPPLDYFAEAYGFRPDSAWFDHARLGALRFSTYCSASFVSPNGLIMTNNHCARESVESVSRTGEDLLENGFYAAVPDSERVVPDLHVDQLIAIEDVTDRIAPGLEVVQDVERRLQLRRQRVEELEAQLGAQAQARDSSLVVEIVTLYQGGMFVAHTFRRYDDVRLVMATEHRIGYFGGDPDNFTYPRYNLDYAFLRAYVDDAPVTPERYFRWSADGAAEGDAVFVIGSPGSTSRLKTMAQLEFERDYSLPPLLEILNRRADVFADFIDRNPEVAEEEGVRSSYLSITNQIKSQSGQLVGLRDADLMARRAAGERDLRQAINANDSLRAAYGQVFDNIADVQRSAVFLASRGRAFTAFGSVVDSQILTRAFYGYMFGLMRQRGLPQEARDEVRESARETEFYPDELEVELITLRLEELRAALSGIDPGFAGLFRDNEPRALAERVVNGTALNDSLRFENLLDEGFLGSADPAASIINVIGPAYLTYAQQMNSLVAREEAFTTQLAQARFAIHGTSIPPDASFSLRIADGVVAGYPYNGTIAPAFTSFAGLYDRHFSFPDEEDWMIPERWLERRRTIDLSVPMNLVTTADITGGNSGSPLINRDLEIVGLMFDSNIDALRNEYIYLDDTERSIGVDSRGILESLRMVYDAHDLVREIEEARELQPVR